MKRQFALFAIAALCFGAFAAESEISVSLKMDNIDYVSGERVRGVITLENHSPRRVDVGYPQSPDLLFVEVYIASSMEQMEDLSPKPFTAKFRAASNVKQKLEVHLGDHYGLKLPRRYLARPVLVHSGMRYEGQYVAFDIVPGMEITRSLQTFKTRPDLYREFALVHWSRKGKEHVFLTSHDEGERERGWETRDLGMLMKITKPVISILPGGKVIVLHRYGPDHFIRSEFWSMPDALEFNTRELINDPETAGQTRVQELYDQSGGIAPAHRPWWKFW